MNIINLSEALGGKTKIPDLRLTILAEHDVSGFEIPMHDMIGGQVLQSQVNIIDDPFSLLLLQLPLTPQQLL